MSTDTRKVDVLALASEAGIAVGRRANVVFTSPAVPMFRDITDVMVEKRHGREWLIWRWSPAAMTPWGTTDCGFGGNAIDEDFIAELKAMARLEVSHG